MHVRVVTAEDFGARAAVEIADELARKPDLMLGTATGQTTVGLHAQLVQMYQAGQVDFAKAALFQIDEYVGVTAANARSCRGRIEAQLSGHVNLSAERVFFPVAPTFDQISAACRRFEAAIQAHGGLDLQVVGIGLNGHIGFNEPGSPFGALTRGVPISAGNAHAVVTNDPVPTHGITMGIRTILNARRVLLLAKGADKAEIVRAALTGPVTEAVPASVLQLHPALTVILDEPAAIGFPLDR